MRKPITKETLNKLDDLVKVYKTPFEFQEALVEDDLLSWFQEHGADYYTYVKTLELMVRVWGAKYVKYKVE